MHKRHGSFDGIDQNLLILFHGLGDTADNFIKFGLKLRIPQTALIAVQGSFMIPFFPDGWAWFPSFDAQGFYLKDNNQQLIKGLIQTRIKLLNYIKSLEWPLERIFLLGFGQGGSVALDLAINGQLAVGGVLSLGGFPISGQPNLECKIPIFISYGSKQDDAHYANDIHSSNITIYKVEGRDLELPQDATQVKEIFKFLGKLLSLRNLALENQPGVIEIT